jgi:hypothetical protein
VIPEAMKKLYTQITGQEIETDDVPKANLHHRNANTIRSYTHEGELHNFTSHVIRENEHTFHVCAENINEREKKIKTKQKSCNIGV